MIGASDMYVPKQTSTCSFIWLIVKCSLGITFYSAIIKLRHKYFNRAK